MATPRRRTAARRTAARRSNPSQPYFMFSRKGNFVTAGMEAGYTKDQLEEAWDTAVAGGTDNILMLVHALMGKSFGLGNKQEKEGNARAAYELLGHILHPY